MVGGALRLLLLIGPSASADELVLAPVPETAAEAESGRMRFVLTWPGGPAEVRVRRGDGWRSLGTFTSPWQSPRLPDDTVFEVRREAVLLNEASSDRIYGPGVVATWSGPGLRGALVEALAPSDGALLVGTEAGIDRWDGRRWSPVLPGVDGVRSLALDGDTLWIGTDRSLLRADPTRIQAWLREDGLPDRPLAIARDGASTWIATHQGLAEVVGDALERIRSVRPCASVLGGPLGVAGCPGPEDLHTGAALPGYPAELRVEAAEIVGEERWFAAGPDGLLREAGGDPRRVWTCPEGTAVDLDPTPGGFHVACLTGGLWRVDARPTAITRSDGMPGEAALRLAPGPAGKTWVGTDRGVALVAPHGSATALPLAPAPAGVPVVAVADAGRTTVLATEDGLVALGPAPRGFGAWRAAVGPDALDVWTDAHGGWWAMGPFAAWNLDRRGVLTRWDLPAEGLGGCRVGRGVALRTVEGVHWWLPGARLLSPAVHVPTLAADGEEGGGLWWITPDEATFWRGGEQESWSELPDLRDVAVLGSTAYLATDRGLWLIDPLGPGPTEAAATFHDGLVAVAAHPSAVWVADEANVVWRVTRDRADPYPLTSPVIGLEADDRGVWVSTWDGVWRLIAPW